MAAISRKLVKYHIANELTWIQDAQMFVIVQEKSSGQPKLTQTVLGRYKNRPPD